MVLVFSVVIMICGLIALLDWRMGLFACVVTALIQDPLRKLVPEEPIYFTLLAAIVLALALINALSQSLNFNLRQIPGWRTGPGTPFALFVFWLLIQSVHSLVAYGNPLVAAVGLAIYLAPIPALILSYQFAIRTGSKGVRSWLRFYLICFSLALTTVVMEYTGFQWDVFGQVGVGMKIYDVGTVLIGKTGIFRSTEVAAWHAMTAACFAIVLLTSRKIDNKRIAIAVVIAVALIGISILTGRRKTILAVAIFAMCYLFLFAIFSKNIHSWLFGLTAVSATLFLLVWVLRVDENDFVASQAMEYQLFLERSKTVFEDVPDRLVSMSVGQAEWATRVTGLLGGGVGVSTTAARYVGTAGMRFSVGEGGAGKIISELGIPGLMLIGWFLLALVRHIWHGLRLVAARSPQIFRLSAGLVAFQMANCSIFFVNTPIFNDFFILIVLGFSVGFLLAMPVIAERTSFPSHRMATPAMLGARASSE